MKSPERTMYLIDSSIYIFRAWQVLPASMTDPEGNPVNAVTGFSEFLLQVLEQTQASYIVCAFDKSHTTSARNEIYPAYKANRSPAPPELKFQFTLCQKIATAFGIPLFFSHLYEADDIIGTLSHTARDHGLQVSVLSADKDLTQCIRDGDEFWNFGKNLKLDVQMINKRFGVMPEQIADLLALCGDKVDNIPGIPGVGEATAARLLKKWGTLDEVFNHTADVRDMKFRGAAQVSELLVQHEQTVRLARQLTGLLKIDELPTTIDQLKRVPVDQAALETLLMSLGFSQTRKDRYLNALERSGASHSV